MSIHYIILDNMGGSESKTTVNALSQSISNIAISTVQSCEVSAQQDQSLTVVNTGFKLWGSYKMDQQSDISAECFNDINKQVELQNKIIDAIAQASSASNIALLGAFGSSSSEATANLTNIVKNNVTMSNIQRSYTDIKQSQRANFTNTNVILFEQIELTQGSKLFAAATLREVDRAGIFNQITSYVDQKSTATMENPLDFIANAIGAVTGSLAMIAIIIILIIAAIVLGGYFVIKMMNQDVSPSGR